mmetsp:Transcript_10089/g.28167  ORF Transcript_10089/g.28167 Transcript_10089/m.28167 type:complete len:210 (-) Transcript_10089:665-1294(-)
MPIEMHAATTVASGCGPAGAPPGPPSSAGSSTSPGCNPRPRSSSRLNLSGIGTLQSNLLGHHFSSKKYRCSDTSRYRGIVARRDVFVAVDPRKEMPSSRAAKRARQDLRLMRGFGPSASLPVFGILASFSPDSSAAALCARTSGRLSASSSFTGSPSMFWDVLVYFTLPEPADSCRRSSTANSKRPAKGPPASSRPPSAVRSARESCSR